MKNLKTILTATALTLGLFSVTFTSCTEDKCKNVVCGTGTCNLTTGKCDCPAGFEGTSCGTESRAKFLNTGSSASTWLTGVNADGCYAPGYTMTIKTASTPTQMIFTNFVGYNGDLTVNLSGTNTFTQSGTTTIGAVTISNVSGSIDTTLNPDKVSFTYNAVSAGTPVASCSSSALKQ